MVPPCLVGTTMEKLTTPIGTILICANKQGIVSITIGDHTQGPMNEKCMSDDAREHLSTCSTWLKQYFADPSKLSSLKQPLLNTTPYDKRKFCIKVWDTLKDNTQVGDTVTYGQLAKLCGKPSAARAVGLAMRTNPFPIIIPCHRVVTASMGLGNYSGGEGPKTKKWLLDYEGNARIMA